MPALDHLNTGFLTALQSAGVDRNAVDVVVNTHIHSDHVGWNTMLDRRNLGADVSQRPISLRPPPTIGTSHPTDRRPDNRRAPSRKRPSSAATSWCSPTACYPSMTPDSSSNGRTTTRSASRCDYGPRPGTHRDPRCCGWMRVSRRSSSAISPTARCNCVAPPTRAPSTSMPARPRPPAAGYSPRPQQRQARRHTRALSRSRRRDDPRRRGPIRSR